MATKETDVFAEIYGHKTKVGTATVSTDGSRIIKLDEAYDTADLQNISFADDEGKTPVSVEPVDAAPVVEAPGIAEPTAEANLPKKQ